MKKIVLLTLAAITALTAQAQKNRIEIGIGRYDVIGLGIMGTNVHKIQTLNAGIVRDVYKNKLLLELRYTRLPYRGYVTYSQDITDPVTTWTKYPWTKTNSILERHRQHFIDIGVRYKITELKNNVIALGLAPSLVFGNARYLDFPLDIPPVGGDIIVMGEGDKREVYFGGKVGLYYDYSFWKNRVNVGADFSMRIYNKSNNDYAYPRILNYGIHLGYNF